MERQLKPFPMPPVQAQPEMPQPSAFAPLPPNYQPPTNRSKPHRLRYIIPIVVIVLILIGGGGYWWHKHHAKSTSSTSATNQTVKPAPAIANQSALLTYVSNGQDLNLNFSYPEGWSVTPPTNDNPNDQTITVTSPLITVESASGSSITGKVVVSIRPGSAQLTELASGNATIAQNSTQIGYSQPLASQQQYPFLSFINLNGGSNPSGGFQEVFVTGMLQLTQGQGITAADLSSLDPYISASFYSCSTQACSGAGETPLSVSTNTWQNTAPFNQILALIQSLQLH